MLESVLSQKFYVLMKRLASSTFVYPGSADACDNWGL